MPQIPIIMPQLGESIAEATIVNFLVQPGDTVKVTTGAYKGQVGTIMQVLPAKGQVIIEGVRLIKKHARKTQDRPDGGIIELEGPIHISNVALVQTAE